MNTPSTKCRLTDIERQAITIWELIHKINGKYRYSVPMLAVRTVRKAVKQFLKNIEGTKYEHSTDRFDELYKNRIKRHLKQQKDDSNNIYLTWLQFQFHAFIHEFCPQYDPDYKDNRQPFYEKTIEVLLQ